MNEIENEVIKFKEFYDSIDQKDIVYMFFTTGLLFWIQKALTFIPEHKNLIIISAGITPDEKFLLSNYTKRPTYHITDYHDDRFVWELLFKVNKFNFAWMDIDCFVLNSNLFDEIMSFNKNTALNTIWNWKSDAGLDFYNTFFISINIQSIKDLRENDINVSSQAYTYDGNKVFDVLHSNIITPQISALMKKVYKSDDYPVVFGSGNRLPYFDTLQMFQILVRSIGYKINKIRDLQNTRLITNEIIHIADSSFFSQPRKLTAKYTGENFLNYLRISLCILNQYIKDLPRQYLVTQKKIEYQLLINFNYKYNTDDITNFLHMNHIEKENIDRLIYSV